MTVKEVIEELQKYPSDMLVYTSDSEYGAEESGRILKQNVWVWDGPNHTVQDVLVIE